MTPTPSSGSAEQARINAAMLPWSDAEIARASKRISLFKRRGMTADAAEFTADRLALRDQEHDDRRMCVECASWQQSRTCRGALPVSFDLLARCAGFKWQTP